MDSLGVRELRQNLSVYLERVRDGTSFEVTSHGPPVALLVPLPAGMAGLERLIAAGRVTRGEGDLLQIPPLAAQSPSRPSILEILEELRGERT